MSETVRMMIHLTPQEADALQRFATRQKRGFRQQAAVFIRQGLGLDGEFARLSPVAVAALRQMAKDGGLDTIDEALECLVWRCAGAVGRDPDEAAEAQS